MPHGELMDLVACYQIAINGADEKKEEGYTGIPIGIK